MQKTAQKRSLLNKLREMTNVSGIAAEKFFNPEFEDVMNRLRNETDDPVRAIVTGEQIGEAEAPADGLSLKALVASAKSNLNRREYMKATADLGRFHKKMYDVVRILSGFKSNLDKVHEKFLFKDLDEESQQHLHDLHNRFSPAKTAASQPYFLKQANILDFFANIGTERGRALAGWEKRYPKQVGQLKKSSASMLSQSEKLLGTVISVLKEMASARATRNPDKYIAASTKIIKAFDSYDKSFKEYYTNNVKPFESIISGFAPKKQVDVSDKPAELGDKEVAPKMPSVKAPPTEDAGDTLRSPPPSGMESGPPSKPFPLVQIKPPSSVHDTSPPSDVGPTIPVPGPGQGAPDTMPPSSGPKTLVSPPPSGMEEPEEFKSDQLAKEMFGKKPAHQKFYETLEKMSGESPAILSLFIKKYALSVQKKDPSTAIQLLKVANSIKR